MVLFSSPFCGLLIEVDLVSSRVVAVVVVECFRKCQAWGHGTCHAASQG